MQNTLYTNKLFKLIDAIEAGKIPLKAVERFYPSGKEVYIARFNGFAWTVKNPTNFITKDAANHEIERICKENHLYLDERKMK